MSQPVRILHVLQRMEAAGTQTFLMSLYRAIDRSKVQFDFLVHYEAPQFFDEEIERLGGRIYRLSFREDYNPVRYIRQLNSFFREHPEYTIVHGHMHTLGAIYLNAARRHGVPVRIAHSHATGAQNNAKKILKLVMNKLYARHATELLACSTDAGRYMFGGTPFAVVNNAISSEAFCFDAAKRAAKRCELGVEDKIVLGCVGRMETVKNHRFSISVFERFHEQHPDSVLLIVGTGVLEQELRDLAQSKGIADAVKFLGSRKDMPELFQSMDLFLFPSIYEGLGIVSVEAQAAGTPVLCNDILPREISVTPLLHRLSLNEGADVWAAAAEQAIAHPLRHTDTRQHIIDAGFDIDVLAGQLEDYYLRKAADPNAPGLPVN